MKKNMQVRFGLPCCSGNEVVITGRKSKQNERGRFHRCKDCGRQYQISVANGKVSDCKNVG